MIREATRADVPKILEWGKAFHDAAQHPFGHDEEATRAFVDGLMESPLGVILTSETGMIGGVLAPAYSAPSWTMAVELFWWAEKGGVKLLKAFEEWAENKGAQEVRMTSLTNLTRADELLKRLDYAPIEISYRKLV